MTCRVLGIGERAARRAILGQESSSNVFQAALTLTTRPCLRYAQQRRLACLTTIQSATTRTINGRVSFSRSSRHWCILSSGSTHVRGRLFSTASQASSSSTSMPPLRQFIKPFLLRCHPDVQTTPDAKQVNLKAIQNLNSYLDSIESMATSARSAARQQRRDGEMVEIDFIIQVEQQKQAIKRHKGVVQTSASRRKVQLSWPSPNDETHEQTVVLLRQHVQQELAKLLRVAGLPIPVELERLEDVMEEEEDDQDDQGNALDPEEGVWDDVMDLDTEHKRMAFWEQKYQRGQPKKAIPQSFYARMAAERRRFTRTIDWKKVDELYEKAWRDAQADIVTKGIIANSRQRRVQFISNILAKCKPDEEIPVIERFCVMRRLSLLLEQHFDRLELEDCSAMWEQVTIRIKGTRDYNTSPSAMNKRRLQQADNGFAFALDANGNVSLEIPLDFRDEELLDEWERNLGDFYEITGDGFDEIFIQPSQSVSA